MRRQAKTAGGIEKVIRRVEPGFQRERGYPIGLPLPLGAGEIIIVFARSDQFKAIGIGETLLPDRGGIIGYPPRYAPGKGFERSEEHTSELQSLLRISYAAFCLKKKNYTQKKKSP